MINIINIETIDHDHYLYVYMQHIFSICFKLHDYFCVFEFEYVRV